MNLESAKAVEVFAAVKANSLGCSFGFLSDSVTQHDGTRLITRVDLLEITLTPSPCQPEARPLGWKSAATHETGEHLEDHSDPTGEQAALLKSFRRFEREVRAERAELERKSRPITLASFDVELR